MIDLLSSFETCSIRSRVRSVYFYLVALFCRKWACDKVVVFRLFLSSRNAARNSYYAHKLGTKKRENEIEKEDENKNQDRERKRKFAPQ